MAEVQTQFEQFHANIRMDDSLHSELRDKREIILDKITAYLKRERLPSFVRRLQGSYKMCTGVKPIDNRPYDMDVGLYFGFDENAYTAGVVRSWIEEAVADHTANVKIKGPCVRVAYKSEGYHVDLVAYAEWVASEGGLPDYRLAHNVRGWVPANPPALLAYVADAARRFDGSEGTTQIDQLRRVIRYLKRWDDENAPKRSRVSGLGYSLYVIEHLAEAALNADGDPDDVAALYRVAGAVSETPGRIAALKPTPEGEDMFAKLDAAQMAALKQRFKQLQDALTDAQLELDPVLACTRLREVFGTDFPVPSGEDTAEKTRAPAIITTSSSA